MLANLHQCESSSQGEEGPAFDMECTLNFLDDIDQYDNSDSCGKSNNSSSDSRSEIKANSPSKGMVMIDQK